MGVPIGCLEHIMDCIDFVLLDLNEYVLVLEMCLIKVWNFVYLRLLSYKLIFFVGGRHQLDDMSTRKKN